MDQLDRELKDFMHRGLQGAGLSAQQKQDLQQVMGRELGPDRDRWWNRLGTRISRFMETTYEISLAPVAVAAGILVMVTAAGIFSLESGFEPGQLSGQVMYMQQTITGADGSIQIVYVPVPGEGL